MKSELISIIKEAGEILKKGYFENKDVNFKPKLCNSEIKT